MPLTTIRPPLNWLGMTTLIAFDTASERMAIGLLHRAQIASYRGEGGAKASAALLPRLLALLADAGIGVADLDAIAFGRGPGAFTGLRTACSVAQGLAFGAGLPVLPLDSLLAVAEDARRGAEHCRVWAVIDARMDQVYAAEYAFADGRWSTLVAPLLTDCESLGARWGDAPPERVAGNALPAFGLRLATRDAELAPEAEASPTALLTLAEMAWTAREGVDAALALPLYVRDKVALTTAERSSP